MPSVVQLVVPGAVAVVPLAVGSLAVVPLAVVPLAVVPLAAAQSQALLSPSTYIVLPEPSCRHGSFVSRLKVGHELEQNCEG